MKRQIDKPTRKRSRSIIKEQMDCCTNRKRKINTPSEREFQTHRFLEGMKNIWIKEVLLMLIFMAPRKALTIASKAKSTIMK